MGPSGKVAERIEHLSRNLPAGKDGGGLKGWRGKNKRDPWFLRMGHQRCIKTLSLSGSWGVGDGKRGGGEKMTVDAVLHSSDEVQAGDFPPFQKA